ncbi:MAG: hypothetical protein JWN34_4048 [Bryobacterales bacterium]|nr:hypothetical protein [Bryobacterales bacterium]
MSKLHRPRPTLRQVLRKEFRGRETYRPSQHHRPALLPEEATYGRMYGTAAFTHDLQGSLSGAQDTPIQALSDCRPSTCG